ncbi:MAG: endolytic transglycosylase MltG [Gammaproteobacteria bacterium]|nr:endolytic transglycosylase MltG [Gammaproteobacteria bacterium]MCF6229792.1 endolytic transglycosylase MltG [Gammaproteobacteria bacterium]
MTTVRKLIGFGLLVLVLAVGGVWVKFDIYKDTPLFEGDEIFYYTVKPGSSVKSIAKALAVENIIEQPRLFEWFARSEGLAQRIQSGEYAIDGNMTPRQLLSDMVTGKVVQHPMTIIEGWSFKQLRGFLAQHEALQHTLDGLSDAQVMSRIGFPGEHPEGRFLPDTYHFPRGTTDLAFLKRAHQMMDETLAQLWETRAEGLPIKTPYQALILASIIEKETGLARERAEIAGVFVRRLQKKMRLQTDPTVIYGMGDLYQGNIRRRDLRRDTPYNTYTRHGLPPTPIALPSAAAIKAALHPLPGETFYFVARGDGSHAFSVTLAEHNRAVVKYQLKGKNRPFSSNP